MWKKRFFWYLRKTKELILRKGKEKLFCAFLATIFHFKLTYEIDTYEKFCEIHKYKMGYTIRNDAENKIHDKIKKYERVKKVSLKS